jgi:hypothetical protein
MKSSPLSFGGAPAKQQQRQHGPSQSQTRVSASADAGVERGRWASCEGTAVPEAPVVRARQADPTPAARTRSERRAEVPASADEPRTGVVRRVDFTSGERGASARSAPASGRRQQQPSSLGAPGSSELTAGSSGDWSCLEWGRPAKERRGKRNSKVTIVQLSSGGDLVRQNGPDAWLPEAGDFMHRMAGLVAQGLGFEQCRSLCLKSASAVLTVAEAGPNVVAVSGPVGSMTNVLRRAGLE